MAHTVEVVDSKVLSDDAIAICVECCGDPSTRSWHTIYEVSAQSEAAIDAAIATHKGRTEMRHEGRSKADDYISKKIKKSGGG